MKLLPPADAYVFDIDGTLLVTKDLVHWNALHQAMIEGYGVDATIEGIPYHGMTDISILRAALARAGVLDEEFEAGLANARAIVCREVAANRQAMRAHLCPGIPELLERLADEGKLLGIASGNLAAVGWHKVEAAGLRELFSFGFFSDRCENRAGIFREAAEHVSAQLGRKAHVCFIGDTPSDVRAAREVGAMIVAVASGTFSATELGACSPDVCISHWGEFLDTN